MRRKRDPKEDTVDVVDHMTTRDLHGYFDWCVYVTTELKKPQWPEEEAENRKRVRNIIHFCGQGAYGFGMYLSEEQRNLPEKHLITHDAWPEDTLKFGRCRRCGISIPDHIDTMAQLADLQVRDAMEELK